MQTLRLIIIGLFAPLLAFPVVGCEDRESSLQEAQERVEEGADEAGDRLEEAADETGDKIEEAGDEAKDALDR